MTDRELLELAAKASSIEGSLDPHQDIFIRAKDRDDKGFGCAIFDPLNDDGDALRLAVNLNLQVNVMKKYAAVYTLGGGSFREVIDSAPLIATRRAIVRAAAELGKAQ
jgi:hypothetical protein